MPAYAEKGENLAEMVHENLGELTPAIFRDLRRRGKRRLAAGWRKKNSRALRRGLGVMQMKMPAKRRREPFYTIYLSSAAGALSSSARLASYPFLPRSAKVACLPASTPGWLKVSMLNMAPA